MIVSLTAHAGVSHAQLLRVRRGSQGETPGGGYTNTGMLATEPGAHLNLKLSRLSWSTDRQPISFMSRSISARRFPSALSTPA